MKAAVLYGREDVRVESVETPPLRAGEVLVRTKVALTCGTDVKVFRRGYHARMIVPPAVFGHELAGVVEELGPGAAGPPAGTPVVAVNSAPCGRCWYCHHASPSQCDDLLFWNGAYAEYARIPDRIVRQNLLRVPEGFSLRRAAMVEPLACVVRGVEESVIRAGQWVAIIGAGSIGLMFAALARLRGARVVVAARRPASLERALRLGADKAVPAGSPGDLGDRLRREVPGGRGADVVVEAVGTRETSEAAVRAARRGGTVQLFGGCAAGTTLTLDHHRLHYHEVTVKGTFHHTPASVRAALQLILDGRVDPEAFITGEASLEELPRVLSEMARGGRGLKTAILP
jgi:L-iditol 2-dehydrogenase